MRELIESDEDEQEELVDKANEEDVRADRRSLLRAGVVDILTRSKFTMLLYKLLLLLFSDGDDESHANCVQQGSDSICTSS